MPSAEADGGRDPKRSRQQPAAFGKIDGGRLHFADNPDGALAKRDAILGERQLACGAVEKRGVEPALQFCHSFADDGFRQP